MFRHATPAPTFDRSYTVGVLPGEGVGPDVIRAALTVLSALASLTGRKFAVRSGGAIGLEAEKRCGKPLSDDVVAFCRDVFADGGAILAGAGGGRFVYDLRIRFDLFCKLVPLKPAPELPNAGRLKPEYMRDIDILVVRENVSGIYQGRWQEIDVVVAPNLFGDILADAGGVLLGSRGLSYSGNFSSDGAAVYQTNHGAAYDLAGTDRANPVGQIFSLAMLLRESFGLAAEADLLEAAVADVWRQGWRTEDIAERGCRLAGTFEMADRIAEALVRRASPVAVA